MNFYCITVRTGCEEIFIESVKDCIEPKSELDGVLHFLKKTDIIRLSYNLVEKIN